MMNDIKQTTSLVTARRGFFTRVAGVMALGAAAFVPTEPRAETEAEDGPDWPGKLTGRHKQLVDATAPTSKFNHLPKVENFGSSRKKVGERRGNVSK
jgi:hypothetical protein